VASGSGSRPVVLGSNSMTGWAGLQFIGNIATGGEWSIWGDDMPGATAAAGIGPAVSALVMESNVYHGATAVFSRVGGSSRDFATWKTFTGSEVASPASVESNPLFIDAGSDDYRIQSGSPARIASPDTCDIDGDANTSETKDAGARQFADNGSQIQIGYSGVVVDPDPDPADPLPSRRPGLRFRMAALDAVEQGYGPGW
jgi:hypothetical protein